MSYPSFNGNGNRSERRSSNGNGNRSERRPTQRRLSQNYHQHRQPPPDVVVPVEPAVSFEELQRLRKDIATLYEQNKELTKHIENMDKRIRLLQLAPAVNKLALAEAIIAFILVMIANIEDDKICAQLFDQFVWWICALVNTALSIGALTWVLLKHFAKVQEAADVKKKRIYKWVLIWLVTIVSVSVCFYYIEQFSRFAATSDVNTRWVVFCGLSIDWILAVVGFNVTAFLDDVLINEKIHGTSFLNNNNASC